MGNGSANRRGFTTTKNTAVELCRPIEANTTASGISVGSADQSSTSSAQHRTEPVTLRLLLALFTVDDADQGIPSGWPGRREHRPFSQRPPLPFAASSAGQISILPKTMHVLAILLHCHPRPTGHAFVPMDGSRQLLISNRGGRNLGCEEKPSMSRKMDGNHTNQDPR